MGSGCLGLVTFPREPGRMTLEQLTERYPRVLTTLREHPGVGFLLVRSEEHGAVALGPRGANYLDEGRIEREDPLAGSARTPPVTCGEPTGSPTAPTSCSTAPTGRSWTRSRPSRSSWARTAGWAGRSRIRSCSIRPTSSCRRGDRRSRGGAPPLRSWLDAQAPAGRTRGARMNHSRARHYRRSGHHPRAVPP